MSVYNPDQLLSGHPSVSRYTMSMPAKGWLTGDALLLRNKGIRFMSEWQVCLKLCDPLAITSHNVVSK